MRLRERQLSRNCLRLATTVFSSRRCEREREREREESACSDALDNVQKRACAAAAAAADNAAAVGEER